MLAVTPVMRGSPNETSSSAASFCEFIAKQHRELSIRLRAEEVEPKSRDSPLRYLNISDEEVREVQSAASAVVGKVLVTIGPVVVGCPCEDGASCTDQVWILAHLQKETVGLLLSRIGGHWDIGTVQRWWLRDAELRSHERCTTTAECSALGAAWRQHMNEFPLCGMDKKKLSRVFSEDLSRCTKQ